MYATTGGNFALGIGLTEKVMDKYTTYTTYSAAVTDTVSELVEMGIAGKSPVSQEMYLIA